MLEDYGYGYQGWEICRRHPDWFVLTETGRPYDMPADQWVDLLDQWRTYDVMADLKSGKQHGEYWVPRGYPDFRASGPLEHGIREIIESTRLFGWDGIRFDSSGFRAMYIDGTKDGRDPVNVRNMKILKERLWQALPNFLIGNNTRIPPYLSKDGRAYPMDPADPTGHEYREELAGGCLWMGESYREKLPGNGNVRYETWSRLAREEARCIRTIKHHGGNFCYSYGLQGVDKARDLYRFVIGTMIGAHQYGIEHVSAGGSEDWGAFLTRWSSFIWGHQLRGVKEAQALVGVASPRPVWWEEFVNEQVVSPEGRYVIVNLLNPPVNDNILETKDELPAPLEGVQVTLRAPAGEQLRQVYLLAPGSPNRAERLEARGEQERTVTAPRFDTWAMVVWELEGHYTAPAEPARFTEPLSEEEKAEIAQWDAKRVKIAVADNLLNPTPQHDPAKVRLREWPAATVQEPEELTVGGELGLDILVLKGLHNYAYHIPEAIKAAAPAARVTQVTGRPDNMPDQYARAYAYDVIVLADYGDGLTANAHKCLSDFVKDGGRLVVVGGIGSLGQGAYAGTPIESVLPVEVRPARDVYRLPQPLALGEKKNVPFAGKPLLYYYQAVKARADARPLLWAGELPIVWERPVGKGTSFVFAGTALGEAAGPKETPFWEWDGWPALLGKLIVPAGQRVFN